MNTDWSVDWESDDTHVLLNPRLPGGDRRNFEQLLESVPDLPAHVWLATSGTSGHLRLVALSKEALLTSAAAVNDRLEVSSADVWCRVLPVFHVGGLAIHARAWLQGNRIVEASWDPRHFVELAETEGVTLTSFVPAQVRDLLEARLPVPSSLRAVVVGGGAMAKDLYDDARNAGWPVLPSYGLTEAASQVATARVEGAELHLLSHFEVRVVEGQIALQGRSLLSGYAYWRDGRPVFEDPVQEGWFVTEDRGEIVEGRILVVHGRSSDFVKIGGESVDLKRLDDILAAVRGDVEIELFAAADERLGFSIHAASTVGGADGVVATFNDQVLPFERIRKLHRVNRIPRSALGKLMRVELRNMTEIAQSK